MIKMKVSVVPYLPSNFIFYYNFFITTFYNPLKASKSNRYLSFETGNVSLTKTPAWDGGASFTGLHDD